MKGNAFQKQLWSFFLGGMTIVMLIAGKGKALVALQTCIIALGLPNTFQTCIVCYAVKIAMDMELHDDTYQNKTVSEGRYDKLSKRDNGFEFWSSSIFTPFKFVDYLITLNRQVPGPTEPPSLREAAHWIAMIVFPWYWIGVCSLMSELHICDPSQISLLKFDFSNKPLLHAQMITVSSFICFGLFIGLCLASACFSYEKAWVLGVGSYIFFVCLIALVRENIVKAYNMSGDVGRNLIAAGLFYPLCIAQMYAQLQLDRPKANVKINSCGSFAQASFKPRSIYG
mmetsp:Transcript_6174/g.9829  ORF Transcript_6174/g.9829 Transcript_6174/m.9829 type:complete len:284 (-) Transcript_6174:157-1008(-)